jgi:hypothetical protein
MKKVILLLVLGTVFFIGYSQPETVKEKIILTLPQSEIEVSLNDRFGDGKHTDSLLCVFCRVHCSEWKRSKIDEIFTEYTYNPDLVLTEYDTLYRKIYPTEKGRTLDTIFQHLYDWINEIEDFANNGKVGDTLTMKYQNDYCCSTFDQYNYFLKVFPKYIRIATSIYMRDQKDWFCSRWTKMKLRTITEFKRLLLDYTTSHNIRIAL